jgi:hypothetical protein
MAYGDCGSARAFAVNLPCLKGHPCGLLMAHVLQPEDNVQSERQLLIAVLVDLPMESDAPAFG